MQRLSWAIFKDPWRRWRYNHSIQSAECLETVDIPEPPLWFIQCMFLKAKKTLSETSFNIVCFKNDQGDLGKIHLQNDSADQFFPLKNQAFQDVLALLTVGSVDALAGCQKKTNGAANWRLKMWVSNWFWSDRFVSFKKGYLSRCDAEDFTFMISGWLESHSKMMKDSLQGFLMFWNTWRLGRYWECCWWNPPLQSTINAR